MFPNEPVTGYFRVFLLPCKGSHYGVHVKSRKTELVSRYVVTGKSPVRLFRSPDYDISVPLSVSSFAKGVIRCFLTS